MNQYEYNQYRYSVDFLLKVPSVEAYMQTFVLFKISDNKSA
jgi:hypothetical protein